MKKLKLFVMTFVAMFVAVVTVNATGLTLSNGGLDANLLKVEDISVGDDYAAKVTVKVNQDTIDSILAQTPGYGSGEVGKASLGIFYVSVAPTGLTKENKTLDKHYAYTSDSCDIECAKAQAKANADAQSKGTEHDDNIPAWTLGVQIQYNKDGVWTTITDLSNGGTSIGDKIKDLTGKSDVDDLVYGEDYIFTVPESDTIWVWRLSDSGSVDSNVSYTYVRVTYDIEFPITASNGERSYYYLTMEQALEEASKTGVDNIVINNDTTVNDDVDIPVGMTIKTNGSAKLEFKGNVTLESGATISGTNVVYAPDKVVKYAVNIEKTENGTVSTDKAVAKKGEEVTITYKGNEGYKAIEVIVTDANGKDVPVKVNKFTMPDSEVTVKVIFEKIQYDIVVEEDGKETTLTVDAGTTLADLLENYKDATGFKNKDGKNLDLDTLVEADMHLVVVKEAPETLDNILTYVGMAIISLGVVGFTTRKALKRN